MSARRSQPEQPPTPATHDRRGLLAWVVYDWANSAFAAVIQTFVFAAYFTRAVAADETTGTTYWGNAIGIAGIVVALSAPVLGAVVDQGGPRKPLLALFTLVCVGATGSLWLIEPAPAFVWPALVLVAVATVGSELANVFYNAMLPRLAPPDRLGRWSGWGWAAGYLGGLTCLVVALFGFVEAKPDWLDSASSEHVRATFVLAAAWYLVFALPLLAFTPDAPRTGKPIAVVVRDGLRQLAGSIRRVRQYTDIVRFLIARMLYIDGLATVFALGGVYAAGTFKMDESQVLMFGIALNVSAGIGAAAFAWIDDWMGSKPTIIVSLVGLLVTGTAVLVTPTVFWFWVFGVSLGIFVGPAQAASRSLMAQLAPAHLQTEAFGLYALSGKATAFAGPIVVGWVTYWTASQRVGMTTVLVFFALGLLLLLTVRPAPRRRAPASRSPQQPLS